MSSSENGNTNNLIERALFVVAGLSFAALAEVGVVEVALGTTENYQLSEQALYIGGAGLGGLALTATVATIYSLRRL